MLSEARMFDTRVVNLTSKVVDLQFQEAGLFESGDVIGCVRGNQITVIGTVLDSVPQVLSVYLDLENPHVIDLLGNELSEGKRLRICEAEPLLSYDLQLGLIDSIISGDLKSEAVNVVFDDVSMEMLHKSFKLKDKRMVGSSNELDESQQNAVENILSISKGELLLIIGPPGTGKTEVIRKAAKLLAGKGERILITSHTNRAVDNALEKLPVEICLRVGRPEKVHPGLHEYMLSYKARTALGEQLRNLEREIDRKKEERFKLLQHIAWLKKERPEIIREIRQVSKMELRKINERLADLCSARNELINREIERLVNTTPIIGSTLVKSHLYPLENINFNTCLIDECSQASITLALLGMVKAQKWVLIGDPKQLLPIFKTLKDYRAQEKLSAFSYLLRKYEHRHLWLKNHYRSNEHIIRFSAHFVYNDKINPAPVCKQYKLVLQRKPKFDFLDPDYPVVFIHCRGVAERREKSLVNEKEQEVCREIVKDLLSAGVKPQEIGVITPYRGQKRELAAKIQVKGIEINTVDAFQGRQKDVIIFSLTATDKLNFASNPNRINVAFTRPKYKLIVVGNGSSIVKNDGLLIYKFLEYVYDLKAIYDWDERKWLV